MKIYSASEAIWPALQRTYLCLFRPFRWATFLKLAAVSTLCESTVYAFHFWVSSGDTSDIDFAHLKSLLLSRDFLPITLLASAAILILGLLCFYLVTQFRFAFLHCLLSQTHEIRPAWKISTRPADRLFKASLLVWLGFLIFLALVIASFATLIYVVFTAKTPDGKLDPGNFLIMFFPCMGFAVLFSVTVWLTQRIIHDFILPHMALENASFGEAWTLVRKRIAPNRETFLSYFILRMLMPLLAGAILGVLAWLGEWCLFGVLDRSATGFHEALEYSTGAGAVLRVAIEALFGLLGLSLGSLIAVCVGGPLGVFLRFYSLFFLSGHYPALSEVLHTWPKAEDSLLSPSQATSIERLPV
jgi:hypothetical protein